MAPLTGTSKGSSCSIFPSFRVTRSIGSLPWGERISRPWLSTVILTHEPSPVWAERSNSILNPGSVANDSAGVACFDAPPPLTTAAAITSPQGCEPSLPKLRDGVQLAAVKPGFSQPGASLSDETQEESVTRVCLLRPRKVRSSLATNAA